MSEVVDNPPVQVKEVKDAIPKEYPFLARLKYDHPEVALAVQGRMVTWKEWMNQHFGSPKVAEALLQSIDYVSSDEINQSISKWAAEVTQTLQKNPSRKVKILKGIGGSQGYFATQVYQKLPEDLRQRVTVWEKDKMFDEIYSAPNDFDEFIKTDYYLFDDSINSGEQMANLLNHFADTPERLEQATFQNGGNFLDFVYGDLGKKPSLNIRTMRITNYAMDRLKQKWTDLKNSTDTGKRYPPAMELDIQAGKIMLTTDEVLEVVGLNRENMTGPIASLFRQDHVTGYTVLGFFATKIQDNLPAVLIKTRLTPDDLTPLFNTQEIKTPWKSFENK